mmetsp:Transcript_22871/g.52379  ORF Transcript_22871/g.52379 Transcript_22871/m.52379 type:complete len:180 (+) Transcript_22871:78-617(+)
MALQTVRSRVSAAHEQWQIYGRIVSQVVEENKTIIWLAASLSSALGGWTLYTLRRVHYAKIEGNMDAISHKIEELEKTGKNRVVEDRWLVSPFQAALVAIPAAIPAFMIGYLAGRTSASFQWQRQAKLSKGLAERRKVYVAIVPEDSFQIGKLSKEIEKAVHEAGASAKPGGPWQQRWF